MTASALEKSQIIVHASASIAYTAYDIRWIPLSPRFVTTGQLPRGTGVLSVYQLQDAKINLVAQIEKPHAFKCATLGHAGLDARRVATGDFGGRLSLWDLDRIDTPVFSVVAHDQIINCIDGCGGTSVGHGPPEIATGSRDGSVKIWDTRQQDPVATMAPKHGDPIVDTWSVAFGNSHNDLERAVCAGYENGDVKMFDLRTMGLLWETNVCSVEFDRKDIKMNKLVVAGLESKFHIFDLRTQHPTQGFTPLVQKIVDNTTVWTVRHLPQNRDIFMASGGSGSLDLFK